MINTDSPSAETKHVAYAMDDQKQARLITLCVPEGYEEEGRIDKYITRFLENASRTKVQRGISQGRVEVNGMVIDKASHTVAAGDVIVCRVIKPPPITLSPEEIPLEIPYEDEDLLIVNKPAGMVVHPAYGHRSGTLLNALLYHVGGPEVSAEALDSRSVKDSELGLSTVNARPRRKESPIVRPGLVHRLDKDTTGLMVVAKHDVAHRRLARQFKEHTIQRRYAAIGWGALDPPQGRIEGAIGRDPRDRKRMTVVPAGRGKHAVTHYETLETFEHETLLRFQLETGRTHQIRVHAAHSGHPLLGDMTYGGDSIRSGRSTRNRRAFYDNLFHELKRQALHAQTLGFTHPATEQQVTFESELPVDMEFVVSRLRSRNPAS